MTELKRCPFCGGECELDLSGDGDISYSVSMATVECKGCGASSEIFHNEQEWLEGESKECINKAVAAWNKRVKLES